MIDRTTEPPFNDRWQGESDPTWGDRPGIVASLVRYRVIVVAATLLGAVAGYGIVQLLPVRYQADAVLILSDPGAPGVVGGGDGLGSSDRQLYLDKQADIMASTVVLERALELLGSSQSPREVRDELDVAPSANMASISIAATSTDPRSAAALANAVGAAYEQVTEERAAADADRAIASLENLRDRYQADFDASPKSADGQLTARQRQLAGQIADVQQRQQDITTQAEVYASGVEYFEQAEPPTSPSQPKPKLGAVLGGLVGLAAAGAWAWRAAARHQRAEDRGEPARILEAPLLGEVPPLRAPPMATGQAVTPPGLDPALEDAYHLIVASMEHELAGVGGKTIAVTSVGPGDNKTSTALHIGKAASQENRKILLIDADLRLRHLSEYVGPAQDAAAAQQPAATAPSTRWARTLGPPTPGPTRRRPGLPRPARAHRQRHGPTRRLQPHRPPTTARNGPGRGPTPRPAPIGEMFDLVLIDAPALLASSDALGVARQADGVLLVVSHRVALNDLRDVHDRLAFVKTPLIGYVYIRPPNLRVRRKVDTGPEERS